MNRKSKNSNTAAQKKKLIMKFILNHTNCEFILENSLSSEKHFVIHVYSCTCNKIAKINKSYR